MDKSYPITEVARLLGVKVKTVQRWDREGRLKAAGRTVTDRRFYTEEQIRAFRQETAHHGPRQTVVYCRVSSPSQRADLKNQRRALEEFCLARGLAPHRVRGRNRWGDEFSPQEVLGLNGCH